MDNIFKKESLKIIWSYDSKTCVGKATKKQNDDSYLKFEFTSVDNNKKEQPQ